MSDLQKHDWEKVRVALEDLQDDTTKNHPYAVNLIAAIQQVLDGLPENDE